MLSLDREPRLVISGQLLLFPTLPGWYGNTWPRFSSCFEAVCAPTMWTRSRALEERYIGEGMVMGTHARVLIVPDVSDPRRGLEGEGAQSPEHAAGARPRPLWRAEALFTACANPVAGL